MSFEKCQNPKWRWMPSVKRNGVESPPFLLYKYHEMDANEAQIAVKLYLSGGLGNVPSFPAFPFQHDY